MGLITKNNVRLHGSEIRPHHTRLKQTKGVMSMTEVDHVDPYLFRSIGIVRLKLKRWEDCPHQGWEGAPNAWLEIDPAFADGLDGTPIVGIKPVLSKFVDVR